MVLDKAARARKLLETGSYQAAAKMFIASGELASAARAFASAKDYHRAVVYYQKTHKPLDAARRYFMIRQWNKAAELCALGGDSLRAEIALDQQKKEQEVSISLEREQSREQSPTAETPQPRLQEAPRGPEDSWPAGEIWQAIRAGDIDAAVRCYNQDWNGRGWSLVSEASSPEVLKGLAETLFLARDHAESTEVFQKAGEIPRSAQCLSLAGLHDAARCHEKNNDPVKAAAVYLKAKQADVALPLLQSIAPSHPSFTQCRLLAGKIFLEKGEKDLAISMLSPILQAVSTTEDGLEAFYQAAILMEMGGATDVAREAYGQLQESRFGYKDVTERLQNLPPAGASAPPPTAPTTSPSPATPPAQETRTVSAPPTGEAHPLLGSTDPAQLHPLPSAQQRSAPAHLDDREDERVQAGQGARPGR